MAIDRRRVGIGLAVTMLLAITAGLASWLHRSHPGPGPLAAIGVGRSVSDPGPDVRIGHPFTFLGAEFDSHDGAVLDDVRLVDASGGLRIVGKYVVLPSESVPVLIGYYFPPTRVKLHPLQGWRVDGPTAVTFALQVDAPGRYQAKGVTLVYHVGSAKYEAFWPIGVRVTAG